jgi:xanthine dehydrogenase/oxidase
MGTITFYINCRKVSLENPAPHLLLVDYLRSPEVHLTGAKKGCGQGGCGACTVILSRWNPESGSVNHRAINSCLKPVCALDGLAITTVEGTGLAQRLPPEFPNHSLVFSRSARTLHSPPSPTLRALRTATQEHRAELVKGTATRRPLLKLRHASDEGEMALGDHTEVDGHLNPVAVRLAQNNGSQCGYCSTGFVMNMSALLAAKNNPTKKEIEDVFDGNLCRCTGYRAILTGMKTFASDWSEEDEANRMKTLMEGGVPDLGPDPQVRIPLPNPQALVPGRGESHRRRQTWHTPTTLPELDHLMKTAPLARLVHANTSYGVYKEEVEATDTFVNLALINEIRGLSRHCANDGSEETLEIGSGTTYSELLDFLEPLAPPPDTVLAAMQMMSKRTAGTIVRNAATLGGNTMMVLKHIAAGEPFPSDLFTVLSGVQAHIEYREFGGAASSRCTVDELIARAVLDANLADRMLILRYRIASLSQWYVSTRKVALREINSHSLVNACIAFRFSEGTKIAEARVVFGGILPYPWHAAKIESELSHDRPLTLDWLGKLCAELYHETMIALRGQHRRNEGLVDEGISNEYRAQLAASFLYKIGISALCKVDPASVPRNLVSAGIDTFGSWPVSVGTQAYTVQAFKRPVSQPFIKLMALHQCLGQVHYTHETAMPPQTINYALVQSQRALANFAFWHPEQNSTTSATELAQWLSGHFDAEVVIITHDNIPKGGVNLQGMGADEPLLAQDRVMFVGQTLAMVGTRDEQLALALADFVAQKCVRYTTVDWQKPWSSPILSLFDAIEKRSVFPDYPASAPFVNHVWKIERPRSRFEWTDTTRSDTTREIAIRSKRVAGYSCTVISDSLKCGGQVHFYMETQACLAIPTDGDRLHVHPSSQSPMEMHQTCALAINSEYNQIKVEPKQLGGGYGGKTEQARFVTGPTAVAARALNRPARLVLSREHDSSLIGKRHPYFGQVQIAVDDGSDDPEQKGIIHGLYSKMWGDGGAFYDCSFIVSNCIQLRSDNAYYVQNFCNQIDVCRTNTAPNTAFRAFGDVQCKLIVENAIDDAAFSIGMSAEEVRWKNLYERGESTPFGQDLAYCYMREVWQYILDKSEFESQQQEVATFNAENRWRKQGLAIIPVKYGSGYNLRMLEQATAILSVYSNDGTVTIHQGGVDMGQGVITQCTQIAAYVLDIPMSMVRVTLPNTDVTPNPTSTGGSTGTAYNGAAVKGVCEQFRQRLLAFAYAIRDEHGDDWCKTNEIDFWNYPKSGWKTKVRSDGPTIWQNLISMAYAGRISLVEQFNAPIRGGEEQLPVLIYKSYEDQRAIPGIELAPRASAIPGEVDKFTGFTYSAACARVEIDVLTGETKILRADLVYDMGWSLNPAIDIGQVEGAFIQGVGYVTTEDLVYQPSGDNAGRLNTVNTWRYKIPSTANIPLELHTYLYPRDANDVPENPNELFSAKEVGEPPLVLATSVFFAIKNAIRASRIERGLPGLFVFDAPASVAAVRQAVGAIKEQQ